METHKINGRIINYKIILAIIVILQVVLITFVFAKKKHGFHSDELWNYGFANSSEGGSVYGRDGEIINTYKWVNSDVFLKYISVDEHEIFDYKSVYINAQKDINPPLQYFILHAVSSVRPGTWSKWYCFVINIISFVITQIFIYKTLKLILGELCGLSGCVLYGFCAGSVNVTIFLRLYALAVAFAVMFFYYSVKFFCDRNDGKAYKKDMMKLGVVVIAGAFTLHQFLIYAFAVTFMYCLYYLIKKDFKSIFLYGGTCLIGVIISIAIFPTSVYHLFKYSGTRSAMRLSGPYQLLIYMAYLSRDITGLYISLTPSKVQSVVCLILGVAAAGFLTICIVLKNKKWVRALVDKLKSIKNKLPVVLKKNGYHFLVMICTTLFILIVCSLNSNAVVMGAYTRRYLFVIYPLFSIMLITLLEIIFETIALSNRYFYKGMLVFAVFFALLSAAVNDRAFYFSFKDDDNAFGLIDKNADCVIVLEDLWIVTCAANELYDTDSFYLTDRDNYKNNNYNDRKIKDNPVYVLIDVNDEYKDGELDRGAAKELGYFTNKEEYLDYYGDVFNLEKCEYIGADYLYDRKIEVYRLR